MQRLLRSSCQFQNNRVKSLLLFLLSLLLVSGECSKQANTHRPPILYGQWKWVELDWSFGPGTGIIYPGQDSTFILTFDSSGSTYSIQVNGRTTSTGTYLPDIALSGNSADSTLDFINSSDYSFAGAWAINGSQRLLIQNDTLSLTQVGSNPGGTASVFKFIPYP
jgi:hypothetical protein